MSQQQIETLGFGSGIMFGFPSGAQTGTNITPVEIGVIQNAKVDITADIKALFGLYSFPIDTAVGKRQIKGSAAFAQYEGTAWNNLMFGSAGSVAAGAAQIASYREAGTIPITPFTVTVAQSAHFVQDGGVRFSATGQPLQAVASGPTTGQYTVSAGVYTFAAADTGKAVVITYTYSSTTNNQTFTITNTAMGSGPTIGLYLYLPYQSTSFASLDRGIYMPNVRIGNFSLATKLDDYTEENTSFECFANPITGVVFQSFLPW
jgi:hypothetical protein